MWPVETFYEDKQILPALAALTMKQTARLFIGTEPVVFRCHTMFTFNKLVAYLAGQVAFCTFTASYDLPSSTFEVYVQPAHMPTAGIGQAT